MSLNRREFMQVLAVAAAAGMPIATREALAASPAAAAKLYELPRFGNVHFLHFTDCHAQLLPIHFREPSVNIGIADAAGNPPHLVGESLLRHFRIAPNSIVARLAPFRPRSARHLPPSRPGSLLTSPLGRRASRARRRWKSSTRLPGLFCSG